MCDFDTCDTLTFSTSDMLFIGGGLEVSRPSVISPHQVALIMTRLGRHLMSDVFNLSLMIPCSVCRMSDDSGREHEGFCQLYRGAACSKFLSNKSIYVRSKTQQGRMEERLTGQSKVKGQGRDGNLNPGQRCDGNLSF